MVDNVFQDLAGSSLVNDLATSLQKMAIWAHPQDYYEAGLALLVSNLIQLPVKCNRCTSLTKEK